MDKTKENKDYDRRRKIQIHLFLSKKEKIILDTKFKESGLLSMSDFLRKLILYGDIYTADFADVRKMNYLLGKIGNNINQIAKKVNTNDDVSANELKEVKEMMNNLWQSQRSILSKLLSAEQSDML